MRRWQRKNKGNLFYHDVTFDAITTLAHLLSLQTDFLVYISADEFIAFCLKLADSTPILKFMWGVDKLNFARNNVRTFRISNSSLFLHLRRQIRFFHFVSSICFDFE
jgi:hypothetical protein